MFPGQIVNEELKYAAILDDCLRAVLEMKDCLCMFIQSYEHLFIL